MVAAPLFLLATPTWLARLIVGNGWFGGKALRWLCHPVVAGLLFNGFFVFTHWPPVVNNSVQYAALHYSLHVVLFSTALLMWTCVCGPLPELRLSLPGRMIYLFCMSIVPTVPSAWLIFAERPIYSAYDHAYTIWGMTPTDDQQTAGVLMKLGAGIYLWVIIAVLFARWAKQSMAEDSGAVKVTRIKVEGGDDILLWDEVAKQLEHAGPAPVERSP
jgi:putative membrane protein